MQAYFAARPELHNPIAAVFLTHTHIEHDAGLIDVANAYDIGGFIYNGHLNYRLAGAKPAKAFVVLASSKQIPVVAIDDATFATTGKRGYTDTVVDPLKYTGTKPRIRVLSGAYRSKTPRWPPADFKDDNNQSLAIRVDYGKASFLFLGDMEAVAQRTLIARYKGTAMLDVDVYHVAHHGSDNGTNAATMAALTPQIAVMGVGPSAVEALWTAYAYGHPRIQAIDALEAGVADPRTPPVSEPVASGVKTFAPRTIDKAIYATGWDGDIVITAHKDGVFSVVTHP